MAANPPKPVANSRLAIKPASMQNPKEAAAILNRWADSLQTTITSQSNAISGLSNNVETLQTAPPVTPVTDGLIHGRKVWPGDAGVIELWDEFTNFGTSVSGGTASFPGPPIGQLGWTMSGSAGIGGQFGGIPPNVGSIVWSNTVTTANAAAGIQLPYGTTSASLVNSAWALFDKPGWWLTWVFKLDSTWSGAGTGFSTAHKTLYIGLCGANYSQFINASATSSRPDTFVGVRFDADSGIGDTTFVLEAVQNQTFSTVARHNTQGTTTVTSVTPTAGVWHRLDILCSQSGVVNVLLDFSNTLTANITPFSFTSSASGANGSVTNDVANINYTIGASTNPGDIWTTGTPLTVSGFSGTVAPLNGTYPILMTTNTGSAVQIYYNLSHANISNTAGTPTLSGYPAMTPCAMLGNDSTGPANSGVVDLYIDYFSFIWNPALGSGGTPSPTKDRYF